MEGERRALQEERERAKAAEAAQKLAMAQRREEEEGRLAFDRAASAAEVQESHLRLEAQRCAHPCCFLCAVWLLFHASV